MVFSNSFLCLPLLIPLLPPFLNPFHPPLHLLFSLPLVFAFSSTAYRFCSATRTHARIVLLNLINFVKRCMHYRSAEFAAASHISAPFLPEFSVWRTHIICRGKVPMTCATQPRKTSPNPFPFQCKTTHEWININYLSMSGNGIKWCKHYWIRIKKIGRNVRVERRAKESWWSSSHQRRECLK